MSESFPFEPDFELDHIGIAVESLEKGFEFYQTLGFKDMDTEEVASEKVKVGFLRLGNRVNLELLEAVSEDSTVRKYLEKRVEGIHQIRSKISERH